MSDKYAALRAAAQEEIMCRESGDTSDAWQDEASPECILELLAERDADRARIIELLQKCENDPRIHEVIDLKERIAELEAQASAHDRLCDSNYIAGMKTGWNLGIANDNAGFNQCLAARVRRWPDDSDSLKIEGE